MAPLPSTPYPFVDMEMPCTPWLTPDVPVALPNTPMPFGDRPQTPLVLMPVFVALPSTPVPFWAADWPHTPAVPPPGPVVVTSPLSATAVISAVVLRTVVATVPELSWPNLTASPLAAAAEGVTVSALAANAPP